MSEDYRELVYVLVGDSLIGVKIEARLVECLEDGSFSMNHIRLDPFSYRNFDIALSEHDKVLLKILRELTHDKLVSNFSKNQSELQDLIRTRGDDFFKKIFRPYVERRLAAILSYCHDHHVPVYQLTGTGAILDEPYNF